MAIALNFTASLKQDVDSQQRLRQLADDFARSVQPALDAALSRVETVHFARILVIDNKYLQILTEFDGDVMQYTEFFRKELQSIFATIFSLVEGAPPWEELNNPNSFFEFTHKLNLRSLGESTVGNEGRGYLFSAFGDMTVREIRARLGEQATVTA